MFSPGLLQQENEDIVFKIEKNIVVFHCCNVGTKDVQRSTHCSLWTGTTSEYIYSVCHIIVDPSSNVWQLSDNSLHKEIPKVKD